jgi:hypothetical protein
MATYTVYRTSDGKEYDSERDARLHQDGIDGRAVYRVNTYPSGNHYEGLMKLFGRSWMPFRARQNDLRKRRCLRRRLGL